MRIIGKTELTRYFSEESFDIGPATPTLIIILVGSALIPLLGWMNCDIPSKPMNALLADSAGLSWASFALLWSIFGTRVDARILIAPLLIAWCWGVGESAKNLHLILPHLLWTCSCLSLQKASWTSILGLWITLDAIWFWYAPFFFPSYHWTSIGPITLALHGNLSLSQTLPGVFLSILFTVAGLAKGFVTLKTQEP